MAKKAAARRAQPAEQSASPAVALPSVELVDVDSLQFDAKNAKTHGERDLAVTGKSLDDFGQVEPLIVWQGTVIGGNGRLQAMKARGWKTCEIRRVDHLSEAKARELAIVLNRSSQLSGWNEAQLLETLREIEATTDLTAIGFDRAEMDALVADALASAEAITGTPAEPEKPKRGSSSSEPRPDVFQVLIKCRDEAHQTELLDRFDQEKLECRALIS